MKFLQKIANGIMVLLILLVLFILFLQFNPAVSEQIGDVLGALNIGSILPGGAGDVSGNDVESGTEETAETVQEPGSEMPTGDATPADATMPENGISQSGLNDAVTGTSYVAPEEHSLVIPSSVEGKSGYEPVADDGQEVSEDTAQSLLDQYGYGELGEGENFDAQKYPYYAMLDEQLQSLYRQIYANANALTQSFVPVITVTGTQLKTAFTAVINDHPELFWMNTAYSYQYGRDQAVALVTLSYNSTAENLNNSKQIFEQCAKELLSEAASAQTPYAKEIAVHDALIAKVSYQANAANNQSAYSAIVDGESVCAGYAKAMQYLLQELDVTIYYCTGYAGESHAWNIISLEDGFYNVDATWDDSDPVNFQYFNGTDEDFSADHLRQDLSVYLPACEGSDYRLLRVSEGSDSASEKPSLEEAGFSDSDVLSTIDSYKTAAAKALNASSENPVTCDLVISDASLLSEVQLLYRTGNYQNVYGTEAITGRGAKTMHVEVSATELSGGEYVLHHTFSFD
ncbi:MAG: hypothetical protein K6G23_01505 [Lachnospiraceae bacterium]|nr:hypothetical protein [Lachnospiraceae bacterium]